MLNHFRPRETSWTYDNAQGGFTMTSLKRIRAGQQVMDSYGKKCNSKFLMHYGFTIEVNREEDGRCQNELHVELRMPGTGTAAQQGVSAALTGVERERERMNRYVRSGMPSV